jgi:hypothetical protein
MVPRRFQPTDMAMNIAGARQAAYGAWRMVHTAALHGDDVATAMHDAG